MFFIIAMQSSCKILHLYKYLFYDTFIFHTVTVNCHDIALEVTDKRTSYTYIV